MIRAVANTEFRIRPMISSDAGAIKEIISMSFSPFLRLFALHSIREDGQVLVSETPEAIIAAFAKLIEVKVGGRKFGCILWLAVRREFRRKGIATALVEAGVECLKAAGAIAVFASIQRRNEASLRVFGRKGFRRMSFLELWRLFGSRTFEFYREIWVAPGEVVLMHD